MFYDGQQKKKKKRIRKERKKIGLVAGLPSSQPIHHPFIGQPKLYITSAINTGVIDVNQLFSEKATILCTETPVLFTVVYKAILYFTYTQDLSQKSILFKKI